MTTHTHTLQFQVPCQEEASFLREKLVLQYPNEMLCKVNSAILSYRYDEGKRCEDLIKSIIKHASKLIYISNPYDERVS